MNIREACADDVAAIVDLGQRFLRSSCYAEYEGPREQLEHVVDVVLANGVVFLAEDDGGPFGMLMLVVVPHIFTGLPYAEELAWWVAPSHRGSSAALRLLDRAEQWARQRKLLCLRMVQPADEPAVGRLYQRRGYRALEVSYHKRWGDA